MGIITAPLPKRKLGSTDCWVSPIGLGTVKLGRNQQVKYPQPFALPDDRAVKKLLETAAELGVNLIDTAPAYGLSEARLGQWLPGKRSDWHLATKVGEEFIDGQSHFNFSEKHIVLSVERSLQRLRTDYLDTVLIHSHGDDVTLIKRYGVLDILATLKRKGWVRCIGMSTKTVEGGVLALASSDVVMATYNLEHTAEIPVLETAALHGKAVWIKKAFASGQVQTTEKIQATFEALSVFSAVSSVIIGTLNPEHLRENIYNFR